MTTATIRSSPRARASDETSGSARGELTGIDRGKSARGASDVDSAGIATLPKAPLPFKECITFGRSTEASQALEDTIIETWLYKIDDDDPRCPVEQYRAMRAAGEVSCKEYSAEELRTLNTYDLLRWTEAAHYKAILAGITLPLDPSRDLSTPGSGPVIFVRLAAPVGAVLVLNGNHRTGAVVREEYNPYDHPLQVLEFSSTDAWEKMIGISISGNQYVDIQVEPGRRRIKPR